MTCSGPGQSEGSSIKHCPLCIPRLGFHSPGSIEQEKSLVGVKNGAAVGRTRFCHRCQSALPLFLALQVIPANASTGIPCTEISRFMETLGSRAKKRQDRAGWDLQAVAAHSSRAPLLGRTMTEPCHISPPHFHSLPPSVPPFHLIPPFPTQTW